MKRILRTLALTGIVAATAAAAQAQVGFSFRVGPAVPVVYGHYVPPCPGVGYVWNDGYYAGRAWTPGRWIYHNDLYVSRQYRGNDGFRGRDDFRGRDGFHGHDDSRGRDGFRDHGFEHRGWDHERR